MYPNDCVVPPVIPGLTGAIYLIAAISSVSPIH
jgi:hypothetical protein